MNHIGTIELTTERLTLRRFELEDAASAYYNWTSDPEVTKYLTWPTHQSVEQTEQVIKEFWIANYDKKDFYEWAIELNEIEQPIGSISAVRVDDNIDAVEIGYCIGREFWHKGYTSEALKEVMRFFFEEVGAGRVSARHDVNNPNSGKVMQKCGMEYEGTMRRADRNNTGITDVAVYAKVKSAAVLEAEAEEEVPEMSTTVTKVVAEDGTTRNVISDETMEYVGILAKLELSPEEAEAAKKDMADMLDYIDVVGDVTSSQGALQVSIKRVRKAQEGEYREEDYLPVSERDVDEMYEELLTYVHKIENPYLKTLTDSYFVENPFNQYEYRTFCTGITLNESSNEMYVENSSTEEDFSSKHTEQSFNDDGTENIDISMFE